MKMSTRTVLFLVVPLALIATLVIAATKVNFGGSSDADNALTYTVSRGSLSISLTESGTVKSRDQHIVKSEVEGRTSIIYVIDEGSVVQEGDLLVELDSSALQDRLIDQQIQVENSEADFISAQEKLEVTRIQAQSNIAKAELDNQFAQEDKVKYIEGEWPKELMESETALTLAQEDLRRATDKFEWSKRLYEEQYLSETEYRADDLARKRADLQVALAKEKLNLLNEFTHARKIAELESEIDQKKLSLQRVNRESASDLVQAESRLRASEAQLTRQKLQLDKLNDQITKTKMFAPADGMIVYATSAEFSWRGDTQPLAEGQEVWERQELIHLPSAESMMVVIKIPESALGKIKLGQRVQVTIDAISDKQYTGEVTRIAPLPDATSVWLNPDLKVYNTHIMIDGVDPKIRTGMSCKATIEIEEYNDVLFIPMQAVVGHNGQAVVYVRDGSEFTPQTVVTGLDNNTMVHIVEGVQEGDSVSLTPPLEDKSANAQAKASPEEQPKRGRGKSRQMQRGKQP